MEDNTTNSDQVLPVDQTTSVEVNIQNVSSDVREEVLTHLEKGLASMRQMFMQAITEIEGLKKGEKIPATKLARQVAEKFGQEGTEMYPCFKHFLFHEYPGCTILRGAHGGIRKDI